MSFSSHKKIARSFTFVGIPHLMSDIIALNVKSKNINDLSPKPAILINNLFLLLSLYDESFRTRSHVVMLQN
jgi:hypothetical protein